MMEWMLLVGVSISPLLSLWILVLSIMVLLSQLLGNIWRDARRSQVLDIRDLIVIRHEAVRSGGSSHVGMQSMASRNELRVLMGIHRVFASLMIESSILRCHHTLLTLGEDRVVLLLLELVISETHKVFMAGGYVVKMRGAHRGLEPSILVPFIVEGLFKARGRHHLVRMLRR